MNQPPIRSLMLKNEESSYQLSDEDIILQYKSTLDNHYVGVLYERYAHIIFGICLKYLKNRHDAEDVMVEIYEKLEITLIQKEVGKFRNWLFVMVKNYCVSKLRSLQTETKRRQSYKDYVKHLTLQENDFTEIDENCTILEEGQLAALVATLPHKQKICVASFYFENKSYKDIAEYLGESVGKIRSYIQNGRRNLKLMLSKEK